LQGERISSHRPECDVQVGDAREEGYEVHWFEKRVLEKSDHQFLPPLSELELTEHGRRKRCKYFHQERRPSGERYSQKACHRDPEIE
jgi:hypothetical protein